MGGRSNNGVPIRNVHIARFNEDVIREIIDAMFRTKGKLFKVKNLAKNSNLKGQQIATYMPHLVESGCVRIRHWNMRYANNKTIIKRADMKYERLIEPCDVETKILQMIENDNKRDRNAMYL